MHYVAGRAGSEREFSFGDDEKLLARYAWYEGNAGDRAREVGTRRENAWGLNDFHGNVMEWCEDTYHLTYEGAPADGTAWTEDGTPDRVRRGGGWFNPAAYCRSAGRYSVDRWSRYGDLGFRPAFTLPDD